MTKCEVIVNSRLSKTL